MSESKVPDDYYPKDFHPFEIEAWEQNRLEQEALDAQYATLLAERDACHRRLVEISGLLAPHHDKTMRLLKEKTSLAKAYRARIDAQEAGE